MTKHTLTARIALFLTLAALVPLAAQSGDSGAALLNTNAYVSHFGFQNGEVNIRSRYILSAPKEERDIFAGLQGRETIIDTPLEFTLLSYYSPITIEDASVRVNAESVLPKNDPRTAGLKLGSAVLKELAELKFLDPSNTAAIGRYEGMIKFISDKNGVTRAEIESYYRQGIGALIAETVDAEFNKIDFSFDKGTSITYGAILTRDIRTGHFKLSYERPSVQNDDKEISAPTLNALLSEMRNGKYKADFDEMGIQSVSSHAALIPAIVYAEWKGNRTMQYIDAIELLKEAITNFCVTPNQDTYRPLLSIEARYFQAGSFNIGGFAHAADFAFTRTLKALWSEELSDKVYQDAVHKGDLRTLASYSPANRNYGIFSVIHGERKSD